MTVEKGNTYKNREGKAFRVNKIKAENDIEVTFVDSGYTCRVRRNLLLEGNVRDFTDITNERALWESYSESFVNNSGQPFHAISKYKGKVKVLFPKTGYFAEVELHNARLGKVRDPFEISFYGQGCIGLPDKKLKYWKQAFQLWQNMMKRCYSEKDERGYFGECTVDSRWKCFENFLNDLKYLEGFDEWLVGNSDNYYRSNLDKDFYMEGNRVYSRNYCRFLPQAYNKSLGKKNKTEKDWA